MKLKYVTIIGLVALIAPILAAFTPRKPENQDSWEDHSKEYVEKSIKLPFDTDKKIVGWINDDSLLLTDDTSAYIFELKNSTAKKIIELQSDKTFTSNEFACSDGNIWRLNLSDTDAFGKQLELEIAENAIGKIIPAQENDFCPSNERGGTVTLNKSKELVPDSRFYSSINPAYDRIQGKYLWLQDAWSFDVNDNLWPLKGWIIDLEKNNTQEINLPTGPWVQKYGFLDDLKWFSCGPQCYTTMQSYFVDRTIYLAIQGASVKYNANGLYRLSPKNNKWIRLIADTFDPYLFISPNGCSVLYKKQTDYLLTNICD